MWGDDGLSVDTKKAKKFLSYFVAQENTLRGELLKLLEEILN